MTPAARIAAAITVLDQIGAAGFAPEQALARWARASRYAGSKDRAAVRDHVFDVLRNWRSDAALGGGESGRARMIGRLRAEGVPPDAFFTGQGHAPETLTAQEQAAGCAPEGLGEAWNFPDWLVPLWQDSLGPDAEAAAAHANLRAPITLRCREDTQTLISELAESGVTAVLNPRAERALTITEGARQLRSVTVWNNGGIELQDASSQAVVEAISGTGAALDFCAGGGGKALALADRGWLVSAHDIDPKRMADIPNRAARAGVQISRVDRPKGTFDLVLCDAPCSGSGAWRRAPQGKWALTPARLSELCAVQNSVLAAAKLHVAPEGQLVYVTCSVFTDENEARVAEFLKQNPRWYCAQMQRWPLDAEGDGFFSASLRRK